MGEREQLVAELTQRERTIRRALWLRGPGLFEQDDLTLPQLRLLYQIDVAGVVSTHELADALGVRAPTVSNTVDRLVRRGLVSRVEDHQDRRRKQITLTEAGQGVLETFQRHGLGHLMRMVAQLDLDDLRDLLRVLNRLVDIDRGLDRS